MDRTQLTRAPATGPTAQPQGPAPEAPPRAEAESHPTQGSVTQCPFHQAAGAGDAAGLRDVAKHTLEQKLFGDQSLPKAEKVLEKALQTDPVDAKGETNFLFGQVYFLMERWGDAAKHLQVALERDPNNSEAAKILERAKINIQTQVQVPGGPMDKFDPNSLLEAPALHLRAPEGIQPLPEAKMSPLQKLAYAIREVRGKIWGTAFDLAVSLAGKMGTHDKVWTNWDKAPGFLGSLKLAYMRKDLNAHTLQSTYAGELVGHQQPGQERPAWTERFRTATGVWNTNDPMEGAAGTEFQFQGAPVEERKSRVDDPSLPSPREVSRLILTSNGPRKEAPFLNNLAIAWIQFQNHDWINHRPTRVDGAYEIPLSPDDPLRTYGVTTLSIPKTSPNALPQEGKHTYLNEVTHWWDASQIYGSDQATQDRLRMGPDGAFLAGGKMRIDGDQLPLSPETGVEDSGFTRNWWVGLDLFHTLFVKEHNYICDTLAAKHPDWSSDQLFHTARLVNSAILAKIHTVEWTPAVLPNKHLVEGMGANWWGVLQAMSKPFGERLVNPHLEPDHPVLGGLVGGHTNNYGKPFALTEEFVEVYRLHAGLPDALQIRKLGEAEPSQSIEINATRGAAARSLVEGVGMANLLNSFGYQKMGALVNNNYPNFLQDMSVDGLPVFDVGAVDILRARERGVPPYNDFRRGLRLQPIQSFEDLGCDAETLKNLKTLYGENGVEKMDLLVGTLCETHRPEFFGFGETLFQIFIQMASRRLQADPFYTEKFNEKYYSKEGMELIEKATLKDILLTHFPELKQSGLLGVNNAFEPWGTTAKDHPEEHPLTAHSERYK